MSQVGGSPYYVRTKYIAPDPVVEEIAPQHEYYVHRAVTGIRVIVEPITQGYTLDTENKVSLAFFLEHDNYIFTRMAPCARTGASQLSMTLCQSPFPMRQEKYIDIPVAKVPLGVSSDNTFLPPPRNMGHFLHLIVSGDFHRYHFLPIRGSCHGRRYWVLSVMSHFFKHEGLLVQPLGGITAVENVLLGRFFFNTQGLVTRTLEILPGFFLKQIVTPMLKWNIKDTLRDVNGASIRRLASALLEFRGRRHSPELSSIIHDEDPKQAYALTPVLPELIKESDCSTAEAIYINPQAWRAIVQHCVVRYPTARDAMMEAIQMICVEVPRPNWEGMMVCCLITVITLEGEFW